MINKTIAIGVPAYNEEANIKKLVRSVLEQKMEGFKIEKVIVSSDGSSDKTAQKVLSIRDKRVTLVDNKDRRGIARGLNQIIENTKSDILVTLDADVRIGSRNFLQYLVAPIINHEVDLTSSSIVEIFSQSPTAKLLNTSMILKNVLFGVFKKGNNIYSCHGLARAYSKKFYSNLSFPVSIGNDMYSYLKCITEGYKFEYTPNAKAYYRLPESFEDHKKQSERFFVSETEMKKIFGSHVVRKELHIPLFVYIKSAIKAIPILINDPIRSFEYFFVQLYLRLKPKSKSARQQTWNMAVSSKKI